MAVAAQLSAARLNRELTTAIDFGAAAAIRQARFPAIPAPPPTPRSLASTQPEYDCTSAAAKLLSQRRVYLGRTLLVRPFSNLMRAQRMEGCTQHVVRCI